jgi:glucose/arabinose dehydrogenase
MCLAAALMLAAFVCLWARGRGYYTHLVRVVDPQFRVLHHPPRPAVMASRPADRDTNVLPDAFVAVDVRLPNSGKVVDAATLSEKTVRLYRTADKREVPAIVNTSGGGDDIVLRPSEPLELNTRYTFEVTGQVKDTGGQCFSPYRASFTTAASTRFGKFPTAFEKVALPQANGRMYTCVTIGPDHKLYASALTGQIFRITLAADGTIESNQEIDAVVEHENAQRLVTGIAFDPASTADHLLLWVSHGQLPPRGELGQQAIVNADDWTGKISLLSGENLDDDRDVVVNLPRANKDHLNNQPVFGPDGALYFCQASNTAMGAPDHKWGYRNEHLLTSAILRLDTRGALAMSQPLDVKTEAGGHYDPFTPGAPLTIYATGVRNTFDLVWHSNGFLYAATNGSAAGGNTPASPPTGAQVPQRIDGALAGPYSGMSIPTLTHVMQTEDDYLFRIDKGAYYGHPNPTRSEYVLNAGNLTGGADPDEIAAYPRGTAPDRNFHRAILSFGKNLSPCGGIEYQSAAFGSALRNKLLYVRYSGGDDIVALTVRPDGSVAEALTGIEGFTHFINPVDLCEDPRTGRLYVAEFGGKRLTLLRPKSGAISTQVCRVAPGRSANASITSTQEPAR